uniref:Receptor kinase-like protein Xa21 n=1 Tax=Oryza brachyantha TaxID=4533 RepID=J3MDT5_ORYBR
MQLDIKTRITFLRNHLQINMRIDTFHPLVSLLISSCVFLVASAQSVPTNKMDQEALLGLKSLISDPSGMLLSWGNGSACTWSRVRCNPRRRISELDLQGLNLVGKISPSIGNLSALRFLYLQNNQFAGEIPEQIGWLGQLQTLNASANILTGNIPAALTNCTNLKTIDLSGNAIFGTLPASLNLLQKLRVLKIARNQLNGSVPPSIGNLSLLSTLDLSTNNLTGTIPYELGHLRQLEYLQLSINNLTGTIPETLYNLSSLSFFAIAKNDLHGKIPSDVGFRLPRLLVFHNCFNRFTGPIPPSLHNVTDIQSIRMSNNHFSGSVPPGLSALRNLVMYNIGFNQIVDNTSILVDLMNCTKLEFIAFDENLIEGILPDSIGNLSSSLTKLYVGGNEISGYIPASIGRLSALTLLNMSYNQLSGGIPLEVGLLKELTMLGLAGNKLSGVIPAEIGDLVKLTKLEMNHNELVAGIPVEFGRLQRVLSLDISSNNLNGNIPASIFLLNSLSSLLNLSHNSLTGALAENIGQLEKIAAIDLSYNFLNGSIPASIGKCQSLQSLSLSRNSLSGVIPDTIGNLKALQTLDLSSNQLSGVIPATLVKMQALRLLNLSMNDLDGLVPNDGIFKEHSIVYLDGNPELCYSNMTCYYIHSSRHRKMSIAIAVGAAAMATITILVGISLLFLPSKWLRNRKAKILDSFMKRSHPLVSYEELSQVTGSFDNINLIGTGGFGSVYKAMLRDGTAVAIKVFDLHKIGALKSWVAECEALRNVRHRNLVKLVTMCASMDFSGNEFRALVYELMSNGSVEDLIHNGRQGENVPRVNADMILSIAIDVATALDYLHNDCGEQIVHCDIKPSNVLLDTDMTAKVGDFGLARLLSPTPAGQDVSSTHGLKGSIGYIPPEYGYGSKPSSKGDVYSYGVMLLAMITGKRPTDPQFGGDMNLEKWVRDGFPHRAHELIDERLRGTTQQQQQQQQQQLTRNNIILPVMEIALSCAMESPDERSTMHDVLCRLKRIREVFLKNHSF